MHVSDGGGIHDVIGTRCDPFTHSIMCSGEVPIATCHQNLVNALDAFLHQDSETLKLKIEEGFRKSRRAFSEK